MMKQFAIISSLCNLDITLSCYNLKCFGSLVVLDVVLDVVFRYRSLFLLYINKNIGKNRS